MTLITLPVEIFELIVNKLDYISRRELTEVCKDINKKMHDSYWTTLSDQNLNLRSLIDMIQAIDINLAPYILAYNHKLGAVKEYNALITSRTNFVAPSVYSAIPSSDPVAHYHQVNRRTWIWCKALISIPLLALGLVFIIATDNPVSRQMRIFANEQPFIFMALIYLATIAIFAYSLRNVAGLVADAVVPNTELMSETNVTEVINKPSRALSDQALLCLGSARTQFFARYMDLKSKTKDTSSELEDLPEQFVEHYCNKTNSSIDRYMKFKNV